MILYFVLQCYDARNRPDLVENEKGNTHTHSGHMFTSDNRLILSLT